MKAGKRYVVFSIVQSNGADKSSTWVKAGSAFVNRDGSINVYLDVLPLDGKLHIREPLGSSKEGDEDKTITYKCAQCGQRIDDGEPCGCGART